jgi:hypothetical protein
MTLGRRRQKQVTDQQATDEQLEQKCDSKMSRGAMLHFFDQNRVHLY